MCRNAVNYSKLFFWRQAEAWNLTLVEAIEVNVLAQGELQHFTQWPGVYQPTFHIWKENSELLLNYSRPTEFTASIRQSSTPYPARLHKVFP